MADTYRITSHGPEFIVTLNAGAAVQLYSTQEEAIRGIKECEQDDLLLVTARRLVEKAIKCDDANASYHPPSRKRLD